LLLNVLQVAEDAGVNQGAAGFEEEAADQFIVYGRFTGASVPPQKANLCE